MLKYLAIFATVLGLAIYIAVQDKHAAEQAAEKAAHQNNATAPTKANEDHAQENIPDSEGNLPSWYGFFRWPNGTTTWAIILTLFAIAEQTKQTTVAAKATRESVDSIRDQARQMKEQTGILKESVGAANVSAEAARASADALINSERAWLLVEKVWFGSDPNKPRQDTIPLGELVIRCEAKNYGRTPARVLDVRAMIEFGATKDPTKIPLLERIYDASSVSIPRWVVLPDRKQTFNALQFDSFLAEEESRAVGNNGTCFIHGIVEYWDMFTETRRFTRFCFRQRSGDDSLGVTETFLREGGDSYNEQT